MRRKNGFNIINEWVKSPDSRLPVNSGVSYAVKQSSGVPMEVMLVSDFSGSMNEDLNNGNSKPSKAEVLKQVVDEVSTVILAGAKAGYNRMGFTLFNAGSRQWNDKHCQIPILPKTGEAEKIISYEVPLLEWSENPNKEFVKAMAKKHGRKDDYFHDCKEEHQKKGDREIVVHTCKAEDTREEAIKILIEEWKFDTATEMIKNDYIDIQKTINQIDGFDGKLRKYGIVLDIPHGDTITYTCPGKANETSTVTTQAWFEGENGQKALVDELNAMLPNNWTNASSGMLMATNAMVAEDPAYRAKLNQIGKNSKKVMIVLSDGYDNFPYGGAFIDFEKKGMCTKIKDRLNKLQDPNYQKQDTRLAFIAISYDPAANGNESTYHAWKRCVDDYYYVVRNKQQLLDAFGEILGIQEELGTTSSQKIKRK